jgi:flagellar basal body-associated protein FliL
MIHDSALFFTTFFSILVPVNCLPMIEARKTAKTISKLGKKKKFPIGAIVAIVVIVVVIIIVIFVVMMIMKKRKAKKNSMETQPALGYQNGYPQAN